MSDKPKDSKLNNVDGERRMAVPVGTGIDCRDAEDGAPRTIAGSAMPYRSDANIGGWFIERFEPGAFTKALVEYDQRALVGHDYGRVIGRRKAGTLRFNDTDTALTFEVDLPDNTEGRDLAVSIDRGDISGVSVRFKSIVEEWDESGDIPIRTVKEAEIFEISVVAIPAYDETDVALRSHQAATKATREKNFLGARKRMEMNQAERERRAKV